MVEFENYSPALRFLLRMVFKNHSLQDESCGHNPKHYDARPNDQTKVITARTGVIELPVTLASYYG